MIRAAVTMRVDQAQTGEIRDGFEYGWVPLLNKLEISPVLIPNGLADVLAYLSQFDVDMLLLTGGNDVVGDSQSLKRNDCEQTLIRHFIAAEMPIFGVCRGLHIVNAELGGVQAMDLGNRDHIGTTHGVTFSGTLASELGLAHADVNSFHAQALRPEGVAPGLVTVATSDDGLVEAVTHKSLPIAAIQWHPERPGPETDPGGRVLHNFISKHF